MATSSSGKREKQASTPLHPGQPGCCITPWPSLSAELCPSAISVSQSPEWREPGSRWGQQQAVCATFTGEVLKHLFLYSQLFVEKQSGECKKEKWHMTMQLSWIQTSTPRWSRVHHRPPSLPDSPVDFTQNSNTKIWDYYYQFVPSNGRWVQWPQSQNYNSGGSETL